MKKFIIIFVTILVLSALLTQPVFAGLYYAGNYRTSAYGIYANIATPSSAPAVYGYGTSHWVSTPAQNPGWVQTGWKHVPGDSTGIPYIECVVDGQPRVYYEYGTQPWGTYRNYYLNYSGGYWYIYIDSSLKYYTNSTASAPIAVQGESEIQDDSRCVVDTWFLGVAYKNSGGSWYYFDQNNKSANSPYSIEGQNYQYHTYGP
jgi:hypothetical protein